MADQATRLNTIANNLEASYQSMQRAAGNIAGLLQVGRATCDEVRAYNLWALALYNTQRGMLETLRANGESNVPALPPSPTLFTWRGVTGADAWKVDCGGQESSLSGLMSRALRGPSAQTAFLSTNELQISTQDATLYNPESSPSFQTLLAVQHARASGQANGLAALPVILITIAGIAIAVSIAIAAIMRYLETSEIQEANTKQVALQADAFANYTAARLACYSDCTRSGKSTEQCVEICKDLVDKPNIKLPGQLGTWGWLQWTGFTVVVGVGALIAYKVYQRKRAGRPIFELPSLPEAA